MRQKSGSKRALLKRIIKDVEKLKKEENYEKAFTILTDIYAKFQFKSKYKHWEKSLVEPKDILITLYDEVSKLYGESLGEDKCVDIVKKESLFPFYHIRRATVDISENNRNRVKPRDLIKRYMENPNWARYCDYNADIVLRMFVGDRVFQDYLTEYPLKKQMKKNKFSTSQEFQEKYESVLEAGGLKDIGPGVYVVRMLPLVSTDVTMDNLPQHMQQFQDGETNPRIYTGHKFVIQRTQGGEYVIYQAFNFRYYLWQWLHPDNGEGTLFGDGEDKNKVLPDTPIPVEDTEYGPFDADFLALREKYGLGRRLSPEEFLTFLQGMNALVEQINTEQKWSQKVESLHRAVFGPSNIEQWFGFDIGISPDFPAQILISKKKYDEETCFKTRKQAVTDRRMEGFQGGLMPPPQMMRAVYDEMGLDPNDGPWQGVEASKEDLKNFGL